jgi:C1A family cysteine protease
MKKIRTKNFGWIRDLPDQRDLNYAAPFSTFEKLPKKIDISGSCPEIYDQGPLGSCTANAIAGALEFAQIKQKQRPFVPSRLFIYYNERVLEGTVNSDAGAQLRDGMKVVNQHGACPEPLWPYDILKFATKPSAAAYTQAEKHQALTYQRVTQTLSQMKGCLASGFPFVFGFAVYESFMRPEVARSGDAPMPGFEEARIGGHAVMAVGYHDQAQKFLIRNSWGSKWGKKGYGTLPYAYLTQNDLAADFWTIKLVE